jgi:hypothetical protein
LDDAESARAMKDDYVSTEHLLAWRPVAGQALAVSASADHPEASVP